MNRQRACLTVKYERTYLNITPSKNDRNGIYKLNVTSDVPVDGFWSISVYNAEGFFVKNERDAYTLNNIAAKKNADGSVTIQFGGWRRQNSKLSSDLSRLELHGAPLSSTEGSSRRHMEISRSATGELNDGSDSEDFALGQGHS